MNSKTINVELDRALKGLAVGEFTQSLLIDGAFQLFYLKELKQDTKPIGEVKDDIVYRMKQQLREEELKRLTAVVRSKK